jgi:dinuclear metal center YbgI/SA1388 family protein
VAYLLESGRCETAVASDLNEGPLSAARATLERRGLSGRVEFFVSDGLEKLPLDGVTDIVVAGMGGETIASILSRRAPELTGVNLVLQPMTKASELRTWLSENGFAVVGEKEAAVRRHCYVVFNARLVNVPSERAVAAMLKVKDIMVVMDKIAPLALTSKDDNSGLLVGSPGDPASKVMLCLDITNDVVNEAVEKGADVIISHHPIIYMPLLRSISDRNPAGLALKKGVACICFHSPLDVTEGGLNDLVYDKLKEPLKLSKKLGFLETAQGGRGYGAVCKLSKPVAPRKAAEIVKDVFGCVVLRYYDGGRPIKKLAFCSGGGGSLVPEAINLGADGYICGDIRNHEWIAAANAGLSLFDAGHYHTEVISVPYIKRRLSEELPDLKVLVAKSCVDPVSYI